MARKISFGDTSVAAQIGDTVSLQQLENLEVVQCQETGVPMLNIDADQIKAGDLSFIKKLGLTISNPDTEKPVALGVDYNEGSFGHALAGWFGGSTVSDSSDDDSDDSSFFSSSASSSSGFGFGGGSSFGGFGGGGFSGGGASGSF